MRSPLRKCFDTVHREPWQWSDGAADLSGGLDDSPKTRFVRAHGCFWFFRYAKHWVPFGSLRRMIRPACARPMALHGLHAALASVRDRYSADGANACASTTHIPDSGCSISEAIVPQNYTGRRFAFQMPITDVTVSHFRIDKALPNA